MNVKIKKQVKTASDVLDLFFGLNKKNQETVLAFMEILKEQQGPVVKLMQFDELE